MNLDDMLLAAHRKYFTKLHFGMRSLACYRKTYNEGLRNILKEGYGIHYIMIFPFYEN